LAYLRDVPPLSYLIAFLRLALSFGRVRWMLGKINPDVIVLFEDNVSDFTRLVGAAASRRNIPYVVLPTTIPNPREAASFFRASTAHTLTGTVARWVAHRWPQWKYDFDGHVMLRLTPPEIIAMRVLGLDCPTPWILNSGQAAAICVEGPATKRIYQRFGVDARQLADTGSVVDDVLFEVSRDCIERRVALMRDFGIRPGRMLVVVAFPPNQFAARWTSTFEYASFEQLVDGWLQALSPLLGSVDILISPHPRLDPAALKPLQAVGCHVFENPTEELVPLADIFVASISATIRWALALGIPVINYDCYRYRYDDFKPAPGMLLVEDQTAFGLALRRLCTSSTAYAELREKQQADGFNWGFIDGQFSARFRDLLTAVSQSSDREIRVTMLKQLGRRLTATSVRNAFSPELKAA
jgi:hypothetical protein